MTFALTLLLLADIGPPPPECVADKQCELTTFVGCCGACCPGLRAAPKGKDERAACKTMNCSGRECGPEVQCKPAPDASLYVAACVARRCEAVLKNAQCRDDADCRLVEVAPADGSCCLVKQAWPLDAGAPAPVIRRCDACLAELPARAACLDSRCAVVRFNPASKKK